VISFKHLLINFSPKYYSFNKSSFERERPVEEKEKVIIQHYPFKAEW